MTFPRELGVRLCHALGLDPDAVTAIDVQWRPDQMPVAVVTMHTNEGVMRELTTLRPDETRPRLRESVDANAS